jgi:hypothetical protein
MSLQSSSDKSRRKAGACPVAAAKEDFLHDTHGGNGIDPARIRHCPDFAAVPLMQGITDAPRH